MIINYQHFVPKGTEINPAKYCVARIFWKMLFGQPLLFLLCLIEQHEEFLHPVEVLAADGFAVVVVGKDGSQGHSMILSTFSRMVATELFSSLENANQRFPKSFREAPR